ncbi:MAG: hypothetical protein HFACDABA_03257 [Anaerolineales bacterium]|nr:hypothetical protein [Anaerolineales bacterium]
MKLQIFLNEIILTSTLLFVACSPLPTPVSRPASPSAIIYSITPSSPQATADVSHPHFASQQIKLYDCFFGKSKNNSDTIWSLIGNNQTIKIETDQILVDSEAKATLFVLLLVPNDVIWTNISLVTDSILPADDFSEIDLFQWSCGQGGSSVSGLGFSDITLTPNPNVKPLDTQTITFPYHLEKGDVYNIGVPIIAKSAGKYLLHLEAEFVLFSGKEITVNSPQIYYGAIDVNK